MPATTAGKIKEVLDALVDQLIDSLSPAQRQTLQLALERYSAGPFDGVFTDGGCSGNPGPGGWAAACRRPPSCSTWARGALRPSPEAWCRARAARPS